MTGGELIGGRQDRRVDNPGWDALARHRDYEELHREAAAHYREVAAKTADALKERFPGREFGLVVDRGWKAKAPLDATHGAVVDLSPQTQRLTREDIEDICKHRNGFVDRGRLPKRGSPYTIEINGVPYSMTDFSQGMYWDLAHDRYRHHLEADGQTLILDPVYNDYIVIPQGYRPHIGVGQIEMNQFGTKRLTANLMRLDSIEDGDLCWRPAVKLDWIVPRDIIRQAGGSCR